MGSSCEVKLSPFGLLTRFLRASWFASLNGGAGGMRERCFYSFPALLTSAAPWLVETGRGQP